MLYCIEVKRDSEEPCVLHHNFENEPTREDILQFVNEQDMNYDDNYGKLNYYKVS